MDRRSFLIAGGAIWTGLPTRSRLRDPRLRSRPVGPTSDTRPGEHQLPGDLGPGGFLLVPESYRDEGGNPLLVGLHGATGNAGYWRRLFEACEARGVVLLATNSVGRTWDGIGGVFGPDVQVLDRALAHTFERCAIDPGRIGLAGFSDGASYALSLGPSNGDLFTHLLAFSPGFTAPVDPIVGRPSVFVSHGSDDRVLPVSLSMAVIVPTFEMDGYQTTYRPFDGGHNLPPAVAEEALDWFLS